MANALSNPDRKRVEEIYERTKYILFDTAKQILRDNSLAEEALQETFSRFIKNFYAINTDDERKTTNYLITTARYIAFEIYNREHRESTGFDEDIAEHEAEEQEDFTFDFEDKTLLKKAISDLSEELRAPFLLYYAQGYTQNEIGRMLEISRSLVSARIIKAKRILKEKLTEKGAV